MRTPRSSSRVSRPLGALTGALCTSLLTTSLAGAVSAADPAPAQMSQAQPSQPSQPAQPATPAAQPATPGAPATPATGTPASSSTTPAGADAKGEKIPPFPGGTAPAPEIGPERTRKLSIDEAVQTALRVNPSIEQQQAAIKRSIGLLDETRVALRPTVGANASFTRQGPIPVFTITQPATTPGGTPTTQTISLGKSFTRSVTGSISYSPDIFGSRLDYRTAARRDVLAARGGLYQVQNELAFSVQNLYLQALRNQELIGVAREAITAAQEQLRVAEAQLRAGTAPEFDVIRAQVQVSNLRQNLVTAEANYRRTLAVLAQTLSLEPNTQLDLQAVALPPEPDAVAIETARTITEGGGPGIATFNTPSGLENALKEAFSNRPEIYSAFWSQRAAEARVSAAKKSNRPVLSLDAGFQFNPDQAGFAVVKKTYSLVANIAIPIWDAGLARARADQARADVQAARAQIRSAQDAVTQEVRTSLLDLEESRERRKSAAANTAQAREALRIARVRYQAGLAPNVEVTDAEAALTQARSNEVNAAYDYIAALANLNRALGRYAGDTLSRIGTGP